MGLVTRWYVVSHFGSNLPCPTRERPCVNYERCCGSGEAQPAQLFIAVLGASDYTFVEATWTQTLPGWLGSHTRAMTYFGGVPALIVPDNLRSGVSRACRYGPDINPSYRP